MTRQARPVELFPVTGLPLVVPGDDLPDLLARALAAGPLRPRDDDVICVAHKVVSKAEGRLVDLGTVVPSAEAVALAAVVGRDARLVHVILGESRAVVRAVPGVLIVETRLGFVCANAGVDHSNVPGGRDWVALLPERPDASADAIRAAVKEAHGADVAVIVNDSHGRPWRQGIVGVAIGCAGLAAIDDQRGRVDLYGRELRATTVGHIDELAAAASLLMGQADEGIPAVLIRGADVRRGEEAAADLQRPVERDLFR